jgi:hypothetical protein
VKVKVGTAKVEAEGESGSDRETTLPLRSNAWSQQIVRSYSAPDTVTRAG